MIKKYNEDEKLVKYIFESDTDVPSVRQKKEWQYEQVKRAVEEEISNRKLVIEKDVVDIYPNCIKIEKETYEYPLFREAFDAAVEKLKEKGIEIQIYTF